jgi:hypothetical protein
MAKLYNLIRVSTATTGSETVVLGNAITGFLNFITGGVQDGEIVSYGIKDGNNHEVGRGTYSASGSNLTRSLLKSTTGSLLDLSGTADIYITVLAEDINSGETPTLVSSASSVGSSSTASVTLPDDIHDGDLLIAWAASGYAPVASSPTGWALAGYTASGQVDGGVYVNTNAVEAHSGSSISFSFAGSYNWQVIATVIRGWKSITGFAIAKGNSTGLALFSALGDLVIIFGASRYSAETLTCLVGDVVRLGIEGANISAGAWVVDGTELVSYTRVTSPHSAAIANAIISIKG